MQSQSSYSRDIPWADKKPGNLGDHVNPRSRGAQQPVKTGKRKMRRGPGPFTISAALLLATGVGAGSLMFSERLGGLLPKGGWAEPSTAWMTLFTEKGIPMKAIREAKAENAVPLTPSPAVLVQEQARGADIASAEAAVSYPATTSSVGVAAIAPRVNPRDLPWLPEPERRVESLETGPALLLARAAVAPPEAAPIIVPRDAPVTKSPISPATAELIKRARSHIQRGDIAGARLLLERAASGSEADALMALAETYDPAMLAQWGARGLKADPGKARALYQRAAESGIAEARARVLALR